MEQATYTHRNKTLKKMKMSLTIKTFLPERVQAGKKVRRQNSYQLINKIQFLMMSLKMLLISLLKNWTGM